MKKIKIKFMDFWPGFDNQDNFFIHLLKDYFDVEISNSPEYIIYSVFGNEHLNYNCIKIFYTGENIRINFNGYDYAIGFDWIEKKDRYIRWPLYNLYEEDLEKALKKHEFNEDDKNRHTKFCNFIYSNSYADSRRANFFFELSKYKHVDSGGRYLNNIGKSVEDKFKFQRDYKFSIAFENSSTTGYTTEKIVQAFAAKTIPIYWGNPNISKEFNDKAFINCHEYNSFEEVINKVIEIDNNDDLYLEMMKQPIVTNYDKFIENTRRELIIFFINIFDNPKKNV